MPRPGDWNCPSSSCGVMNFASRSACFKCSEPKPTGGAAAAAVAPATTSPRPNAAAQYASRATVKPSYDLPSKAVVTETYTVDPTDPQKCQWRGLDMEALIVVCTRGKPGDWICSSEKCSHTLNFAARTECLNCSAPCKDSDRDDYDEVVQLFTWLKRASNRVNASPKYLGEWSCTKCSALNYAKQKTQCFKCAAPKEGESYNPGAKDVKVVVAPHYKIDTANPDACTWRALDRSEITNLVSHGKPGDWLCTKCCNHNYKARGECKQCNEPAPPNGQGQEWFNEVVELFSWMKKPARSYYGKRRN